MVIDMEPNNVQDTEIVREKVELEDGKNVYLYESDRSVPMDEVREQCEANGMDVPEENSRGYWEIVDELIQWDWECLCMNIRSSKKLPEKVVITGYCGRWDGRRTIKPVITDMADPEEFFRQFAVNGDYKLSVGYDEDGLFVSVVHHDASDFFTILEVTEAGRKYLERCARHDVEPDILSEEKFTSKIDYRIF